MRLAAPIEPIAPAFETAAASAAPLPKVPIPAWMMGCSMPSRARSGVRSMWTSEGMEAEACYSPDGGLMIPGRAIADGRPGLSVVGAVDVASGCIRSHRYDRGDVP